MMVKGDILKAFQIYLSEDEDPDPASDREVEMLSRIGDPTRWFEIRVDEIVNPIDRVYVVSIRDEDQWIPSGTMTEVKEDKIYEISDGGCYSIFSVWRD